MATSITLKQELRKKMRALLYSIASTKRIGDGVAIANHVEAWLKKCRIVPISVAFFKGLPDEISTEPLDQVFTRLGVNRHIPFIDGNNELSFFKLSPQIKLSSLTIFGLDNLPADLGPSPTLQEAQIQIIFVPGLAFDRKGHRLGRGKGYYDRTLAKFRTSGVIHPVFIGLAMDEQIIQDIPMEKHDVRMDFLCTKSLGLVQTLRS